MASVSRVHSNVSFDSSFLIFSEVINLFPIFITSSAALIIKFWSLCNFTTVLLMRDLIFGQISGLTFGTDKFVQFSGLICSAYPLFYLHQLDLPTFYLWQQPILGLRCLKFHHFR